MTNLLATVKSVIMELKAREISVVTAESCTGGGLAYYLTMLDGSSAWFERGFITYSNAAKIDLLAVDASLLAQYGAVSRETACAMAAGALANSNSQIAIAITGIAGPTGGTADKPVGTVWIAIQSSLFAAIADCEVTTGDRNAIRERSIARALQLLEQQLKQLR